MYQISSSAIGYINSGDVYFDANREYPIRPKKNSDITKYLSYTKRYYNLPDIEYRKNHTPSEVVEYINKEIEQSGSSQRLISLKYCSDCGQPLKPQVKGTLCAKCLYEKKKHTNRLSIEDINFNLIEHILDTSLSHVAREYGYTDGSSVKHLLKANGLPYTIKAMFAYYEQQTGHSHHKLRKKETKLKSERRPCQPVCQYDTITEDLISTYPSITAASRNTNISTGHISECCRHKRKTAGGFSWQYADNNNE